MALITKFKDVTIRTGNGVVASGEEIKRGTLLMVNAAGFIEEVEDTANTHFAGIADSAAAADEKAIFNSSALFLYLAGAAAQSDVGDTVFVSGAGTIAKSSSQSIVVGQIVDVVVGVGWWVDTFITGPVTVADSFERDAGDSAVRPKTAGDAIHTGDINAIAKILSLDDNVMTAAGTDTHIPVKLEGKGTGTIQTTSGFETGDPATDADVLNLDDNIITVKGVSTNPDIKFVPKGTGVLSVASGTYEANVTDDDDLPNKKYVDDAIKVERDAGDTAIRPKTAGDAFHTDDIASTTKILKLDDNKITADGTDTNVDVQVIPKGTGVVNNGTNPLLPYEVAGQATTGTGGSQGEIAAVGVTATAVIIAIGGESGSDVAYVVAGTDKFTVYDDADVAIDSKKVNYLIISY